VPRYLDSLERELLLIRQKVGKKKVVQLHLGGGTPTYLTPEELESLIDFVWQNFERANDSEVSIEIDPTVTGEAHLEALQKLEFNRLSMGVQDFNETLQKNVNRNQTEQKTIDRFTFARKLGFQSINIDLMYGLPGQTIQDVTYSTQRVCELGADRIAVFGYAHVPWIRPHQKRLEIYGLASTEDRWGMAQVSRNILLNHGYKAIGMDHFAKPEDELSIAVGEHRLNRNFQGYTVLEQTNLIGIGLSAISDVGGYYLQNEKRLSSYTQAIESGSPATIRGRRLSQNDQLRRTIITKIMCNLHVEFEGIEQEFNIEFHSHFEKELESLRKMEEDKLITISPNSLSVQERGRPFLRNVAMAFDEYLSPCETKKFSRTI